MMTIYETRSQQNTILAEPSPIIGIKEAFKHSIADDDGRMGIKGQGGRPSR
jgi:hypothetical protein